MMLCFEPKKFVFVIKIALHVKKQIPGNGRNPFIEEIRNNLRNF